MRNANPFAPEVCVLYDGNTIPERTAPTMAPAYSGPGQILRDPRAPIGAVRAALIGFDVDSDELKREHKTFLDASVIPILAGKRACIWLQGQASHTGSQGHNLELSHRRALQVATYLKTRGALEAQLHVDAVGDSLAGPRRAELASQRAVSLLATPLGSLPAHHPAPPPPTSVVPITSTSFQIRLLGALSAGAGIAQVERMFFQVWDPSHMLTCFYLYESGGLGKGVGAAVSATLTGPWNRFDTSLPIAVDQFGGAARFSTAGGGAWTWNYLNLMGLPPGVKTIPNPLTLETGFTVGLGVSTSVGKMVPGLKAPYRGE
jgi:hypothetical protein